MIKASRKGDEGAALVLVIGVLMVTTLFLLSSLAYAINNLEPSRRDQDAKIATAAAQAGIDEYVSRLTANSNYWELGTSDSTNLAFTTGQSIQGTSGAGASYTYTLLTTANDTAATGLIRLRVTGRSAPSSTTGTAVTRSLTAELRPKGFLSYVYLSDVEVVDPEIVGNTNSACANYYYLNITARTACTNNIQWVGADRVNGPLHSNDALLINGPVNFTSEVTESSWPALNGTTSTRTWWTNTGQNAPLAGFSPKYGNSYPLPTANATLKQYVAPDVDGDTGTPVGDGCYYQGATRIIFTGTTMSVYSPGTKNPATPSRCYDEVTTSTAMQTGLDIPPVIYVDAGSVACTTGQIGIPAAGESYTAGTSSAVSWGTTTNYNCQNGSVYVEGTADAQVTVAANNDVVVTGDLKVANLASTSVIGLIAGNCVWVYHPVTGTGSNLYSTTQVTTIEAAILSLRHSFLVQNWGAGAALGTLSVSGAIAQKYRGPVGTGTSAAISTGYYKNYVYDSRLGYLQPPYFLKSDTSPWKVASIQDK